MDFKKFIYAVTGTFSAGIGAKLLSFVTTILIVRNMPPAEYGIFALVISFSLTLTYLSIVGLPQVIVYFLGKMKEEPERVVGLSLLLTLCIGMVTILLGCIFKKPFQQSFLKELSDFYYYILLFYFFISLVDTCLLSIFRGFQNYLIYNIRRVLTPLGNLLGVCFLFFFLKVSLGSIIAVFIAVNVLTTTFLFLRLLSKIAVKFHFNWELTKSFFGYGMKSYFQLLIGHFIYQVDIYIISFFCGAKEVAFYSIAVGIATLLWFIPDNIGTVLFPTLASKQNEDEIHLFSAQVCRNTLFILFIGAVCLSLIGKYLIVSFYGDDYVRSINSMLLILPGIIVMSGYKILTRDFSSRNRQQYPIIAGVIALIVNICLNFIWIPRYGIEGAAMASTAAYFIAASILIIIIRVESGIGFRNILLITKNDITYYIHLINRFIRKNNNKVLGA